MTIIHKRKEYEIDGHSVFVEKYQHKEMRVPLWRYGMGSSVLRDGLMSRPNVKRIFGGVA